MSRAPFRSALVKVIFFGACSLQVGGAFAYQPPKGPTDPTEIPAQIMDVGIDEKLGDGVDLNLQFKDETGATVPLSRYFSGSKPVMLSLVYFACPSMCNLHLNGLTEGLKGLNWTAGQQFDVLAISIDPNETPELAASKKESYLQNYGREGAANGWHFLTGSEADIRKLADSIGFKYKWNEEIKEWAHASAAVVLTPEGRISRYLHGMSFVPQTIRLSLVEASDGKVGSFVDSFVLFCFQYDPKASKYTLYAYNIMRAGGVAAVLILTGFLAPFWIRQRRET